jgi:hypothetical protein
MALVLKGGAIFLHIPKTGGNWITKVLEECGLIAGKLGHKHAGMDRLLAPVNPRNGKMLNYFRILRLRSVLAPKPFMFCFVRHPLAWYESWFKYMTQPSRNWRDWGNPKDLFDWHPNAVLNGCGAEDFNQFVRNVVDRRPGYVTELYASYAQPQIDFIGKQENLQRDLVTVLKQLNLDFDEDFVLNYRPVGVSPEPTHKVGWNPELRERVLALEQVALLRYGYIPAPGGL